MIRTYKERWWMVPGATLKRKREEENTQLPTPVSPTEPQALGLSSTASATSSSKFFDEAAAHYATSTTSSSKSSPVEAAAHCAISTSSTGSSSKSTPGGEGVPYSDKRGAEPATPERQLSVSTDVPRIPHRPRPPVPRLRLEREFPPPPFRLRPSGSPPPPPPEDLGTGLDIGLEIGSEIETRAGAESATEIGPDVEVDQEGVMRMFLKRRKLEPGALNSLDTVCDAPPPGIESLTKVGGKTDAAATAEARDELSMAVSPFDSVDASLAELQLPLPQILSSDTLSPVTPTSPAGPQSSLATDEAQLSQGATSSLEERIQKLEEEKTDLAAELQAQKVGSSLLCEELRAELRAKAEELGALVAEGERLRRENQELRERVVQQAMKIQTQLVRTQQAVAQQAPTTLQAPYPAAAGPPPGPEGLAKQTQVPTLHAQLAHPNPNPTPAIPIDQAEVQQTLKQQSFALHQVQQALWSQQQYTAHLEQEIGRREAERNGLKGYVAELQGRLQMCASEWQMMMVARRGQMQGQVQEEGKAGPRGINVRPPPQPQSAGVQVSVNGQQPASARMASKPPSLPTANSALSSAGVGRPPAVVRPAFSVQQTHPQSVPMIQMPAIGRPPANVRPVTGVQQAVPRSTITQLNPHVQPAPGSTAIARPQPPTPTSAAQPMAQQAVFALQTTQAFHMQQFHARQAWLASNPGHPQDSQRSVSLPQPVCAAQHPQVPRRSVSLPQTTGASHTQHGQSHPSAPPQAAVTASKASI